MGKRRRKKKMKKYKKSLQPSKNSKHTSEIVHPKNYIFVQGVGATVMCIAFIALGFLIFLSLKANLGISLQYLDNQPTAYTYILFSLITIFLIIFLIKKIFKKSLTDDFKWNFSIFILGALGSWNALLYILSKGYNINIPYMNIDGTTAFMGVYFFGFYTLIYNAYLVDVWEKISSKPKLVFYLILMEIPNFLSWWSLILSSPINFISNDTSIDDLKEFNNIYTLNIGLAFSLFIVTCLVTIRIIKYVHRIKK